MQTENYWEKSQNSKMQKQNSGEKVELHDENDEFWGGMQTQNSEFQDATAEFWGKKL